ncbi:hypothetical protein M4914_18090 [Streptomyces somaliensis DSM 40738]|uniref:Integral membrane protein n=1 Tax=Streptomyces somaliensis (strain ATCC 33201 / DSM 40738 / JCM 12659 / KCTC 9044 / NCTC 11332 / NRRL B-12077 / IP 733) TaxID=1134445 RepID=A0AA44DFU1_STRE0|nr:hypothetical protein [Streptomyces somaliensis]MCQ0024676.1 hypothetical protein [Streptomyces somaliensis DSM 40738]NKY16022.1 hypothetical protein [Streptomyces somaliensis DSM 40738]
MSVPFGPRLLRTAVFTAVCVALSALGHSLAAGQAVPSWTLGVGFAGILVLALPFSGRERSLPAITTALAGGQLALHTVFGVGQEHAAPADADGPAGDALVRAAARLMCGEATTGRITPDEAHRIVTAAGLDPVAAAAATGPAPAAAGALDQLALPSLSMVLAHLLAALPTAWLLRRGDLALLRLHRLAGTTARGAAEAAEEALVRALRAALVLVRALLAGAPLLAVGPRTARAGQDRPPAPVVGALQHTVIRRGPPAALVLAA